jgi:tetratricopeptide (TPR) repeat protein
MDVTELQQQAQKWLDSGCYEQAIALYSDCVEANPTVLSHYWQLGLAQFLQGDLTAAQSVWFAALMMDDPHSAESRMADLVQVLLEAAHYQWQWGRVRLAIQLYEQLLAFGLERPDLFFNLGLMHVAQGNVDAALDAWQQALDLDPTLTQVRQKQADLLRTLGQIEEAIASYKHLLEHDPQCEQARCNLGVCYLQQQEWDQAIACFQAVMQPGSGSLSILATAYSHLGLALLHQGEIEEAIAYWHQALNLQSQFVEDYLTWADGLTQTKQDIWVSQNVSGLRGVLTEPTATATMISLGRWFARQDQFEAAIALYQYALSLPNPTPDLCLDLYLELGNALTQQKQGEQAIAAYEHALILQPACALAYLELGKLRAMQGQWSEAIACYRTATTLDCNLADAYFYWGDALAMQGQWSEAIACYRRKLELQPDAYDAYYRLGLGLAKQGQIEEAIDCWQRAIAILPHLASLLKKQLMELGEPLDLSIVSCVMPVDPPNGFYASTYEWATSQPNGKDYFFVIEPEHQEQLQPPQTLESEIDLRFCFGEGMTLPAAFVAIVPDGRYFIEETSQCAVIAVDGKILPDLSPDFPILSPGHPDKHPSRHAIFTTEALPPVQRIKGTVAILSGLFNNAYFHWLVDVLPRWELVRRSPIALSQIDWFLVSDRLPFQREMLNRLGIASAQILDPQDYPHIRADQLVAPSFAGSIAWPSAWVCKFLQERFLESEPLDSIAGYKRVYITRQHASNRRVINEHQVIQILSQFGVQPVALETMSVAEQAALFAQAEVVISPHGSGLTNIVFCQPGTQIIEFFSPSYVYPCYWYISSLKNLNYYYLLGEPLAGPYFNQLLYQSDRTADLFIPIDSLMALLQTQMTW